MNVTNKLSMSLRAGLFSAALLAAGAAQAQTVTGTLASVNNADLLTVQSMTMFTDLLREKTKGEVDITVVPGGVMGGQKENLEAVIAGSLEMAHTSSALLGAIVPELQLFDLPFLFRDNEHMAAVLRGPIGEEYYKKLQDTAGVQLIMVGLPDGPRSTWNSKRPIKTPADMVGLTIRTPESAVMIDTFTALGALPTAMPFNEVYMAAKQGVIDGAESAPYALSDAKAWEVAGYYSLTKHITLTAGVVMNSAWFNSLSAEHQAAMIEARDEASAWYDSQFDTNNERVLDTARANGMQVNEVDDIEDFRKAVAPVYEKYAPVVGGMDQIQAVIDTK